MKESERESNKEIERESDNYKDREGVCVPESESNI